MPVSGDFSGGMYVISGLIPSTTYSIQVAAETSAGTGPYSAAINQLTDGKRFIADFFIHTSTCNPLQLKLQSCQLVPVQPPPSPSPGLVLAQRLSAMR